MKTAKEIRQMPLVMQMYEMAKESGVKISIKEAYNTAVASNLVDEQGEATKWAIDNGMVAEVKTSDFAHLDYPNFIGNLYDDYVEETSLTDEPIMSNREFYEMMLSANLVYPEGLPTPKATKMDKATLEDWITSDELQAKMTVTEFIDACEPLKKYDAKHIQKVGNGFGFDMSLAYDLAKRVVNGELDGDVEASKAMMKRLEDQFGNDIEPL